MQLELIPSHKIDKEKWNESLKKSSNGLLYASSVYLDIMADNWDAVVNDDYDLIMPIPWRKKFGIKYCYTVPFIQQLGVFGNNIHPDTVDRFYKILKSNFKYGDYSFNYTNAINHASTSNNYILSLSSKHSVLNHFYQSHLEKNLKKAKNFSLHYATGNIDEAIAMFRNLYDERIKISLKDYEKFIRLCHIMHKENNVVVRKVKSNNETVSIVLLMKFKERLYNIMSATNETGRQQSAGSFLYDSLIHEFAQTGLLLDFEGSDIPGIEFFYKGFGAVNQPYFRIHLNNLFYPLRLFKR